MKKTAITVLTDVAILLALVIISVGLWYAPWITVVLLAMLLLGGFLLGNEWD